MKELGTILIVAGIVIAVYALFFMDTSVAVNYPMGNSYGFPEKVNNLGLMADKQNYLTGSGIAIIVGLILCFLPKSNSTQNQKIPNYEMVVKTEVLKTEKNELELLKELKDNGVFSEEEYNSKINEMQFNLKLQEKIKPILKTLNESKEKGLLSEIEFIEKKNKAIETQTLILKDWEKRIPKISDIDEEILAGLQEHHIHNLKNKIELMAELEFAKNNVIVFNDNKIKTIALERWEGIIAQGHTDKFKLIFKI